MRVRFSVFLLILIYFSNCDKFSLKKSNKQLLDTIVDFSSVDASPYFKNCDTIINKKNLSNCFRTTIYTKVSDELNKHQFTIQNSINEMIHITLLINKKGVILLDTIESSKIIKSELPLLDSILQLSINKLPVIYPAIKRGIPVSTKYKMPINIYLKE